MKKRPIRLAVYLILGATGVFAWYALTSRPKRSQNQSGPVLERVQNESEIKSPKDRQLKGAQAVFEEKRDR